MTKDAIKPISTYEVLQQALEALNLPSMKTQQMLIQRDEAIDALRQVLSREHALYELARLGQELQPEPLGWAVEGCSKMWRGEYAELDAKDEARRIGGTCFAYALFTRPRLQEETKCKWPTCQNEEYQNAMAEQLKQELYTGRRWVGLTKVQRDDFADAHGSYQAVCAIEQALKERNNG